MEKKQLNVKLDPKLTKTLKQKLKRYKMDEKNKNQRKKLKQN